MRDALQRLWDDLMAFNRWLDALPRRSLEGLLNHLFTITKSAGLHRVYARDVALFLVMAWILVAHWETVAHTGFVAIWHVVQGGILAKILGELLFGVPFYLTRLAVVFVMPDSLMVLLPALLPYLLGWYVASRYVEDVFEISDALRDRAEGLRVAQEFLLRAAFAHGYGRVRNRKTWACRLLGPLRPMICPTEQECLSWGRSRQYGVRVSFWRKMWDFVRGAPVGCPHTLAVVDGEVKERRSPLLLIGGPGYAFVSTDSAVLFERADGTPHVVGPTTHRLALLEGFERVRRIVSLREHQVTLSTAARSRDGIPVEVKDVQLLFGIYRGGRKPTANEPFPFYPPALEHLVYNELASPVSNRWEALSSSRLLTNAMRVMARADLNRFIRSQTVVEFLASVSQADVETLQRVYRELAEEIAAPNGEAEKPLLPPLPEVQGFVPRPRIAERFDLLANGPQGERARQRGVGLQWIGLGAWHSPVEKVINQHVEAWRLSVANLMRSNKQVLSQLERQRHLSAFTEYIRELLAWFQNTQERPPRLREIVLLRYFVQRLEIAALAAYGGIAHAPAAWRHTIAYLQSLAPHDVDRESDVHE